MITNSIKHDLATTGVGAAVGSSLVVASEVVQGWAKAGSAVVGFLILCVTLAHASVKLARYIKNKP